MRRIRGRGRGIIFGRKKLSRAIHQQCWNNHQGIPAISQCFPSQKWSTVVTQITRAGKITNFANVNDRLDMVEQRQRLVVWSNTRTGTFCVCGCRFTVHTIRWVNGGGGGGEKERKWYFFGQGEGVTMPQRLPEFTVNDFFTIPLIGTMSPLLPKQPDKKSFCSKKSTAKLLTMTRKLVLLSTPQRLLKLSERLTNYWRGGAFRGSTPTSHWLIISLCSVHLTAVG